MIELPDPEDLNPFEPRTEPVVGDYMGSAHPNNDDRAAEAFDYLSRQTWLGVRADIEVLTVARDTVEGVYGEDKSIAAGVWLQTEEGIRGLRDYKQGLFHQIDLLNEIAQTAGITLELPEE